MREGAGWIFGDLTIVETRCVSWPLLENAEGDSRDVVGLHHSMRRHCYSKSGGIPLAGIVTCSHRYSIRQRACPLISTIAGPAGDRGCAAFDF